MNNENEFNDWDSVEAAPEHTLIPKGDYKMSLEKVNHESVKSGDNEGKPRYSCQFTITDDRQTGRKIFRDFMPHSEKSRGAVKSLALATNTALVGNMCQVLINSIDKNFIANVGISKGSGEYPDHNAIWAFKPLPVGQYQQHSPAQQYQPAPVAPQTYAAQPVYAPAPQVQPQQPISTGETALCQTTGKPIYKATDGQWYYS